MSTVISHKKKGPPEKRKSRRRLTYLRFVVHLFTEEMRANSEAPILGTLTDVNPEGLGLIAEASLPKGAKVILIVNPGHAREQEVRGLTVWTQPLPTSGHVMKPGKEFATGANEYWRVGLKIDVETEEERCRVAALLKGIVE